MIGTLGSTTSAAPRGRKAPTKKTPTKTDAAKDTAKDTAKDAAAKDTAKDTTPETPKDAGTGNTTPTAVGTGSTTAPATPTAPTATPTSDEPKSAGPDVDSLRQEYLSLRDELFTSRARANAVASQLYSTRIAIKLTYTTGRFYNPSKASIRLDGAAVYDNTSGAIAGDDGTRFEGYVAPGRHVITFRVEATGKDDDSFASTTEASIVVKAVANKDLVVAAKARDSGDIAYAWKRGESGSYGLAIDVGVKTAARAGTK
ncbi:MAG: hypothetical protein NT062_11040 [Proteobacteria bacterium]|nr:hypothetical protein [Pseudomonadota bacterium]